MLLKTVLPYLRIKRKNAELALEFRKYVGFKRGQLTKEISEKRSTIALQLRELNQRFGKGNIKNLEAIAA